MKFDNFAMYVLQNLDVLWTFVLLISRYTGLMIMMPGIGMGAEGLKVRGPAIIVFTMASLPTMRTAPMPPDYIVMAASAGSEFIFGYLIGLVPQIIVIGVQAGAQLATNTMGLSGSSIFDPTTGASSTDLSRIEGGLVVLMFLLLGGHYTVMQAVSGLSGQFTPGSFNFDLLTADFVIQRVASVFKTGVMISAPVIVALLLTQFVMGIISRAVPTVNIFVVSFPLTIGIGLILTILSLPEVIRFAGNELASIDNMTSVFVENMTDFQP